jgi:branched-chain amino acid aminotransferase
MSCWMLIILNQFVLKLSNITLVLLKVVLVEQKRLVTMVLPCILLRLGQAQGFHQMLWTDAKTHEFIEESGTMNVMFIINGKLVTPTEDSDTILRGITKRSIIEVAKSWGMEVEERKVTVKEIVEGIKSGAVSEMFGAGTAATLAHIVKVGYQDEVLDLSPVEKREFSNKMSCFFR